MAREVTADVFASPAISVLCDLEHDGFEVTIVSDAIRIEPHDRLTPERMADVRRYRHELKTLLHSCDPGVEERRDAFRHQLASAPEGAVPAFLFQSGVPYAKGFCFSCGDRLEAPRFGRCWRCALGWRLALRVQIPAELAAIYDETRQVA